MASLPVSANTHSAPPVQTPTVTVNPTPTVPVAVSLAKPFLDVSKIEVFSEHNFKRWQERIFSLLDMHGVAYALTDPKPAEDADHQIQQNWQHANKVCRHTIL